MKGARDSIITPGEGDIPGIYIYVVEILQIGWIYATNPTFYKNLKDQLTICMSWDEKRLPIQQGLPVQNILPMAADSNAIATIELLGPMRWKKSS